MKLPSSLPMIGLIVGMLLGGTGCPERSDPVGILQRTSPIANQITADNLQIQKAINTRKSTVTLTEAAQGQNEDFSIARAVAFRVSQLCAQVWDNEVFYSYQIEAVTSGWNVEATREFFVTILGIPEQRVIVPPDATPSKDLSLSDNWYEITFTNGRTLLFQGTARIFHEPYLTLRDRYLNGDPEVTAEQVLHEEAFVKQALRTLPLTDAFVIIENP